MRLLALRKSMANTGWRLRADRAIACQDPCYTRVKHTLLNDLDEVVVADPAQTAVVTAGVKYRFARSAKEFYGGIALLEVIAC